jgi:hypothetical protein
VVGAEIQGGRMVQLNARHGDLLLVSAILDSTASSKGTLKLEAGRAIHAEQAALRALAQISLQAKDSIFAELAKVLACSERNRVAICTEGDVHLSQAVVRAIRFELTHDAAPWIL